MEIKTGCGVSDFSQATDRAARASDQAMGEAGVVRAHTAMVFMQAESTRDYLEALSAVRRVTGAKNVVGASAGGVLNLEREWEGGASCAVMVLGDRDQEMPIWTSLLRDGRGFEPDIQNNFSSMMTLGDPAFFNLEAYEKIYKKTGAPIFGGGASGFSDDSAGAPVFHQGGCFREASCAVAFGAPLKLTLGVVHGCRAVCAPIAVTKSKGNLVLELSGKPAVSVLEKTLSKVISDSKEEVGEWDRPLPLLAGVMNHPPSVSGLPAPADFSVRPIMAVDSATGGIRLGEQLKEGNYLTFVLREKNWAHQELQNCLQSLRSQMNGSVPKFGFYFNCAGRGSNLFEEEDHDVSLIRSRLGDFPLVGLSTSFELAPQNGEIAVHSFTGVLALFS